LKPEGYYIIEDIVKDELGLFENKIKEWEEQYPNLSFKLIIIPSLTNGYDNTLLSIYKHD
jgi:hypothetical protein